jgi:hypothetical protein
LPKAEEMGYNSDPVKSPLFDILTSYFPDHEYVTYKGQDCLRAQTWQMQFICIKNEETYRTWLDFFWHLSTEEKAIFKKSEAAGLLSYHFYESMAEFLSSEGLEIYAVKSSHWPCNFCFDTSSEKECADILKKIETLHVEITAQALSSLDAIKEIYGKERKIL